MPLRFTLRQLEYLVAVGECGSIAQASARVNVSSPSISAAIAQLEAEFGLPLFVRRHAHGLSLTQGGRQFVSLARKVLAEAATLSDLAQEITGTVGGPLAIGCLQTFAQVVLPQLRRSFEAAWPAVSVSQTETDQAGLISALRRAEIDVALTYDLQVPPDMEFYPLVELPPHALMPPDHPLAGRAAVSVEDLAPYPMVLLDLPLSSEYFLSFFAERGLRPLVVERSRDIGVMRSMVANGYGYSIANLRPVSDYAPDGRPLVFVPLAGGLRPMTMGLMTNAGASAALAVSALLRLAREQVTAETIAGLRRAPHATDRG